MRFLRKIFGGKKKGRSWGGRQIKEMTRLGGRLVIMSL